MEGGSGGEAEGEERWKGGGGGVEVGGAEMGAVDGVVEVGGRRWGAGVPARVVGRLGVGVGGGG